MTSSDFYTPEDFIVVQQEHGFPINAITCLIARAEAVVLLLHERFDGTFGGHTKDECVANALWSVDGDLRMLRTMIEAAYCSTRQEVGE